MKRVRTRLAVSLTLLRSVNRPVDSGAFTRAELHAWDQARLADLYAREKRPPYRQRTVFGPLRKTTAPTVITPLKRRQNGE